MTDAKQDHLREAAPDLYKALAALVDAAGLENGLSLFSKARDGLTPIRIVVTKAQVLNGRRALEKARGP